MLSKTGLYVVRTLAELAKIKDDSWMCSAQLAKEIGAPMNYLRKLLHILAHEEIIISQKGVGGGVRLARASHEISLYDALAPFENFPQWSKCLLGHDTCPCRKPCYLSGHWTPVQESVLQFLRTTSAADLANQFGFPQRFEHSLLPETDRVYEQQAS